jgi:hypothetical protein
MRHTSRAPQGSLFSCSSKKGACTMRATIGRYAACAAILLAMTGCRSTSGSSGWTWGRKSTPAATSVGSNGSSAPILPSANATPTNSYASAPSSGSSSSPYPDPGASNPYPATQAAGTAYPGNTASAPSSYGATPAAYGAAGAPQTAPGTSPQVGRYNENFGQPAGGAYAANPPDHYQSTAGNNPAGGGAQPPAHGYQGAPNSYSNVAPDPPARDAQANPTPPAGGAYAGGATPDNSYPAGDNHAVDRYGVAPAQPEQAAADRYATSGDNAPAADASTNSRYQPGATSYNPGQTNYNPPGAAPYQMAAQPNTVQPSRRDPYYRPGGTGDYMPNGSGQTPPAGAPSGQPPQQSGGTIYR